MYHGSLRQAEDVFDEALRFCQITCLSSVAGLCGRHVGSNVERNPYRICAEIRKMLGDQCVPPTQVVFLIMRSVVSVGQLCEMIGISCIRNERPIDIVAFLVDRCTGTSRIFDRNRSSRK